MKNYFHSGVIVVVCDRGYFKGYEVVIQLIRKYFYQNIGLQIPNEFKVL